ncbi:transposase domain-containing protein [Pseudomonas savastanoi]|nr:transposase domain-containing protein [Pseudomonas savastanoi]
MSARISVVVSEFDQSETRAKLALLISPFEVRSRSCSISLPRSALEVTGSTIWYAYLKDVLKRLPTQRASEIEDLLPHKWAPV